MLIYILRNINVILKGKGIKQYLDKAGIQPRDLLPVYILHKILPRTEKFGLYKSINFIALEVFDDEEYDSRYL